MIIPNMWENKKWQPNHQPVMDAPAQKEGVVNGVMTDLRSSIFWDGATDKLQGPPQKRLTMNGFGRLLLAKPNEKW